MKINIATSVTYLTRLCVTMVNKKCYKSHVALSTIGKYKMISKINTINTSANYFSSIYKFGRKKYFIKTWVGKFKDINYYKIHAQFNKTLILHSLLKVKQSRINILKPIEIFEWAKNGYIHVSIVFPYVKAKTLSEYSDDIQVKVINQVTSELRKVHTEDTQLLNTNDHILPSITYHQYKILNIVESIVLAIGNPSSILRIIKLSKHINRKCKRFINKSLVLVHGDFSSDNILMKSSGGYTVIDWENACFTYAGYDLSGYQILSSHKLRSVHNRTIMRDRIFFQGIIAIHHAIFGVFNPPERRKYMGIIKELAYAV